MSLNTSRRKVLVADDYPDAADLTAELLRLAGYEAVSVNNGLQVLEVAASFRPDLVILDIDMPVLDGYATARALRKLQAPGSRLVLIAHTGRTQPSDEHAALEAGFDRHVKKPLTGEALCDLVAAYLTEVVPQGPLPFDDNRRETRARAAEAPRQPSNDRE